MKNCKLCKEEFNPIKHYYKVCPDCLPKVAGCKTCRKMVIPDENGLFKCCGFEGKVSSSRSTPTGWHKEEWELLLWGLSQK